MQFRKHFKSVLLLAVLFLALGVTQAHADVVPVNQLTDNEKDDINPQVCDSKVVWQGEDPNDDDPSENRSDANYEFFGTHFLIFDNRFIYANDSPEGVRAVLVFHHSGFDPPGRNHLLSPEQAQLLEKGTLAEKKAFMLRNLGLDADTIHFFNNRFTGVDLKVAYRSVATYGAKSKGWRGIIDVTDTVNGSQVAETVEQALEFFD